MIQIRLHHYKQMPTWHRQLLAVSQPSLQMSAWERTFLRLRRKSSACKGSLPSRGLSGCWKARPRKLNTWTRFTSLRTNWPPIRPSGSSYKMPTSGLRFSNRSLYSLRSHFLSARRSLKSLRKSLKWVSRRECVCFNTSKTRPRGWAS